MQFTPRLRPAAPARTLFGFSRQPTRKQKPPDFDPGLKEMLQLVQALAKHERPPERSILISAFTSFILDKQENERVAVEDSQIGLLLTTFRYLQDTQNEHGGLGLSVGEMVNAMSLLTGTGVRRAVETTNTVALARSLYDEVNRKEELTAEYRHQGLKTLIEVLAAKKKPTEARALLEGQWTEDPTSTDPKQWINIILGFAKVDEQDQMIKTIEIMEGHDISFDSQAHQYLVEFYASNKNVEMTKKWYDYGVVHGLKPTQRTLRRVLGVCIYNNELEWGEPLLRSLVDGELSNTKDGKAYWKLVLQWAAAKGKSVEELDRLLNVMIQKTGEQGMDVRPDIGLINSLIAFATFKNDPYTAERYLALGRRWGLEPDSKTLLLQLDYRISSGDLDGAKAAYDELKGRELETDADLKFINRLIVAMCNQKPLKYDVLMELVDDLTARKARLNPETVSALALVHLQRGELHDLIDLLNTHVYRFEANARLSICHDLVQFCFDRSMLTARIWDAYNIIRQTFREMDLETRTKMIVEFFERSRSDMATHVFGHIRHLDSPDIKPTLETYVLVFEGIAKAADAESLALVHNMLKLDATIEPNTKLYNALMLAYMGCGDPRQALIFWDDIIHSREGPTYNSIQIALRACGDAPFGERQARDIWSRLKRFDIRVTREIHAAYIGALAGQALFDDCTELINNAKKEAGLTPDVLMLGTFHNSLPNAKQEAMKHWAAEKYPAVWAEVQKLSKRNKMSSSGDFLNGIVYNVGTDIRA
ncbi:MAG: hypothetical protein LQ337_004791 [Flavoplaca oasis]|nr:MAG: hypothetical protein LQ337_004791 [Flavoplaca oasis]